MSALAHSPFLSLELEPADASELLRTDPLDRCRFCRCTQALPCLIPLREDEDRNFYLARSDEETMHLITCSWFVPKVCSKPECIEKLLLEARGKLTIFDAYGNRTGS